MEWLYGTSFFLVLFTFSNYEVEYIYKTMAIMHMYVFRNNF